MDFQNLAATISTLAADVPRMQKQIDELKLEVLRLYMNPPAEEDHEKQSESQPTQIDNDPDAEARRKIEEVVAKRLPGRKYATQTSEGVWQAPFTASDVAELMGNRSDWPAVLTLIRGRGWQRLTWFHAPPPPDWKGGYENCKSIQWVEVRND